MRIVIDISQVIYGTGVSVYTKELVSGLVKLYPKEQFLLYGGSLRRLKELKKFACQFPATKNVITPLPPSLADLMWNRLHVLPIEEIVGKVDVFHSSDWAEPPAFCFKVTTIHDMAPLIMPEYTPPKIVNVHKRKFEWVKKEVDRVIVPSESTKKDAVELGIKSNKLRVIPEALRSGFGESTLSDTKRVIRKYQIDGKYAISIGTNPRKNAERIFEAFTNAKSKSRLSGMVVVGENNQESNVPGVVYTGKVNDNDLKALYTGAELLIYTSLYEGFGLPILEAFACGCPVLTSNISSMPEVAGDAAILVDPRSVEDIAEGIVKTLKEGEKLIKKGKSRVKSYNWEEIAKLTMNVYRESGSK